MDLIDKLKKIGDRFKKLKEQVGTEEATKTAFVLPFISALGYDVFNPLEVIPEYVADIGVKKGEKVDYCIIKNDEPIIIIECKHWKETLTPHKSQLHRYFHVTSVKFAILTNGIDYRFYSDLTNDNKMDDKPFLEFNLSNLSETTTNELKRFHSDNFDAEEIISVAGDLKYSKEIKELLSHELKNPSDDFIKYFAGKVYSGRMTSKVLEQFSGIMKRSVKSFINELINERLQTAITKGVEEEKEIVEQKVEVAEEEVKKDVITTEEEKQGFRIVQAILAEVLPIDKINERDTKSYFGILYNDNNRTPICRLWLNRSVKYLEVFGEDKKGQKIQIEDINDIYKHKDILIESVQKYLD